MMLVFFSFTLSAFIRSNSVPKAQKTTKRQPGLPFCRTRIALTFLLSHKTKGKICNSEAISDMLKTT